MKTANETLEYLRGKGNPLVEINPAPSRTYQIQSLKSRAGTQIQIDYWACFSKLYPTNTPDYIRPIQSCETNHY